MSPLTEGKTLGSIRPKNMKTSCRPICSPPIPKCDKSIDGLIAEKKLGKKKRKKAREMLSSLELIQIYTASDGTLEITHYEVVRTTNKSAHMEICPLSDFPVVEQLVMDRMEREGLKLISVTQEKYFFTSRSFFMHRVFHLLKE